MSEKLTRKELLDLLGKGQDEIGSLDDLDRKALDGYQYLDTDQSADNALRKLDKRFDKWLDQKEVAKEKKAQTRIFTILQRVAAVILVLMIPALFLLKSDNPAKLADRYFDAPRSSYLTISRGGQVTETTAITKAFALYEKGNYAKAAIAIDDLMDQYPEKGDLKFYKAISLFGSGQTSESIEILKTCAMDSYEDLDRRAPWYLGLAYLKYGNIDEAKIWLNKAAEMDSLHQKNAQKILEDL